MYYDFNKCNNWCIKHDQIFNILNNKCKTFFYYFDKFTKKNNLLQLNLKNGIIGGSISEPLLIKRDVSGSEKSDKFDSINTIYSSHTKDPLNFLKVELKSGFCQNYEHKSKYIILRMFMLQ